VGVMKTNTKTKVSRKPVFTYNGARAANISLEQQLERSVMSCLLFEGTFYEDGKDVSLRILDLASKVKPEQVAELAAKARTEGNLRHVPLILAVALAKRKKLNSDTVYNILNRPDEAGELIALYWKEEGKKPLPAQMKKGIAEAFNKWDSYQISKYRALDSDIKLRDVLFLTHPNPKNNLTKDAKKMPQVYKKLANNTLEGAETWEKKASEGEDQKKVFTNLIKENKLGALAMLRNLRNMQQAGVDASVIKQGITNMNIEKVLPFRFITAAKYAPEFEPELEEAMLKCLNLEDKLPGKTILLVDVSGSMTSSISNHSEMSAIDAAAALAILLREKCEDVRVYTFNTSAHVVPARHGFALRDAIIKSVSGGTSLGASLKMVPTDYDRMIIITDEQSNDTIGKPAGIGYIVNVRPYQNGLNYKDWIHVDGFSESVIKWIEQYEDLSLYED
jgi:hypothetical protein